MSAFDENAWDDLLNFIEEKQVIPILGPELIVVPTDAGPENLYTWVARTLAARLGLDPASLPERPTLDQIVTRHLAQRGRREDLYTRIRSILRESTFVPPPALLKLAEITDFNLFVSTTFDSLLEDAINVVRFGGLRSTDVAAYTPSKLVDLPTERELLPRPFVYHLLGRLSAAPTYVISDEDVLEFVCALQSRHYAPEKLFGEPKAFRPMTLAGDETRLGSAWIRSAPSTLRWVTTSRLATINAETAMEGTPGFAHPSPISAYVMAPSDRTMIVRTSDGTTQAWHLDEQNPRPVTLSGSLAAGLLPIMRGGSGNIAAGSLASSLSELRVWDLKTGELIGAPLVYRTSIYRSSINFSADGKWVGAGTSRAEAKIWEVGSGRLIHDLKPLRGRVTVVRFSPDRRRIATSDSSSIRLWDTATGGPVGEPFEHPTPNPFAGEFSRDGKWLITYTTSGGTVQILDATAGRRVGPLIEHSAPIAIPAFSPDGTKVATACSDGFVRLWDVNTGQLVAEPMPQGSSAISVMYSPDGRFLRTNAADRSVRIWAVPPTDDVRPPAWLLRLATAYAGKQVSADGSTLEWSKGLADLDQIRDEVMALPPNAPFNEWARWLLADPAHRPIAPGFSLKLEEAEARGMIAAPVTAVQEPRGPDN